jgi:hypothetical protein
MMSRLVVVGWDATGLDKKGEGVKAAMGLDEKEEGDEVERAAATEASREDRGGLELSVVRSLLGRRDSDKAKLKFD